MRPSRLQMVVLPISSECTAPDDSNTIAPPARWPHSSVLSSSSASRGVSATRRGLRSLPPPCSTSADLQSAKHAARACSTLPRARRQVCRPRSVLLGWHAPRQRAASRGVLSPGSSPLQHLQESNTRRLRSQHLIAASGSFACEYGGEYTSLTCTAPVASRGPTSEHAEWSPGDETGLMLSSPPPALSLDEVK
jgi:hypothetical protein